MSTIPGQAPPHGGDTGVDALDRALANTDLTASGQTSVGFPDPNSRKLDVPTFDDDEDKEQPANDADTSGLVKPLKPGESRLKWDDRRLTEFGGLDLLKQQQSTLVPSHLETLYNDLRGSDFFPQDRFSITLPARKDAEESTPNPEPSTKGKKRRGGVKNRDRKGEASKASIIRSKQLVKVLFRDNPTLGVRTAGGFYSTDLNNAARVEMTIHPSTAVPGFTLFVTLEDVRQVKRRVGVTYTANCIRHSPSSAGPISSFSCTHSKKNPQIFSNGISKQSLLNEEDGVIEFKFRVVEPTDNRTTGASPSRPIISGIEQHELEAVIAKGDKGPYGDTTKMTKPEWALYDLFKTTHLSVYRLWRETEEAEAAFNLFSDTWVHAMRDANLTGNFAYVHRFAKASDRPVDDFSLDLSQLPVPMHLVQWFRVTVSNDRIASIEPDSWNTYQLSETLPDAQASAIDARLAIARTRQWELRGLQEIFSGDEKVVIKADFMPVPGETGVFWIEASIDPERDVASLVQDRSQTLAPRTLFKVTIIEGIHSQSTFRGMTMDDVFQHGQQICGLVYLSAKSPKIAAQRIEKVQVSIELQSDGTACTRQSSAICIIGRQPRYRKEGPDFAHWFLGARPQEGLVTDTWARRIYQDPATRSIKTVFSDAINKAIAIFTLNSEQQQAVRNTFTSASGMELIWGPPGTGKTFTLNAIMLAQIMVPRWARAKGEAIKDTTILATAPTNNAVANMLKKFVQQVQPADKNITICLFIGGYVRKPKAAKTNTIAAFDQETAEAARSKLNVTDSAEEMAWKSIELMEQQNCADPELYPYYLHTQVAKFRLAQAKDTGSKFCHDARWWFRQSKIINEGSAQEKEEARKAQDIQRPVWNSRFLEACDIVFCTDSTAAHEELEPVKPDLWVQDEAAQAGLTNSAVPAAAHPSIKQGVGAGDNKQLGPTVMSRGSNECFHALTRTLFKRIMDSNNSKVMLKIQRRCKPYLSRMPNKIWYEGELVDHQAVKNAHPIELTLREATATLRPYFDKDKTGATRIAVDVSGKSAGITIAESVNPVSKSFSNTYEASAIVEGIMHLLKFQPKDPKACRIRPEDIMVISPYGEQVKNIRHLLIYKGIHGVTVCTSTEVQGGEKPVVFVSNVRNDPNDPMRLGFTKDSQQLCVNHTRAQMGLFVFWDIKRLVVTYLDEDKKLRSKNGKWSTLGSIVNDFHQSDDIVSFAHWNAMVRGQALSPEDDIRPSLKPSENAYHKVTDEPVPEPPAPIPRVPGMLRALQGEPNSRTFGLGSAKRTIGSAEAGSSKRPATEEAGADGGDAMEE